jgi:DMSO/TMAO reductase YedYZ molybdopterin-dependent catalytic subunit
MRNKVLPVLFATFLFFATAISKAQSVKISGEVATPITLNLADMQAFKQTTVIRKDKDGKNHTYAGVTLVDILQKAGATMGADLKGANLAKFILIEAADGYKVVFALAELDSNFTNRTIILATMMDDALLPIGDGPFRVIVQDEKKPARCIKQVTAIKVQLAK